MGISKQTKKTPEGIVSLPAFGVMTNPGPVYEQYTIKTGIAYNIQQFNILHRVM